MRIEENVSTTSVRLEYRNDEEGRKQYRLWRDVDARRNIGIARLRGEDSEDKGAIPMPKGPMFIVRKSHNPVPHAFQSKEANIAYKEKAKNRAKLVSPYL